MTIPLATKISIILHSGPRTQSPAATESFKFCPSTCTSPQSPPVPAPARRPRSPQFQVINISNDEYKFDDSFDLEWKRQVGGFVRFCLLNIMVEDDGLREGDSASLQSAPAVYLPYISQSSASSYRCRFFTDGFGSSLNCAQQIR